MAESGEPAIGTWRYGLHPQATGMRIASLGRVNLQLGEALRIEMTSAGDDTDDIVHLQYYVATELGPWALWLTCPREDVDDRERLLQALEPSFEGGEPPEPSQDLFPFLHIPKHK